MERRSVRVPTALNAAQEEFDNYRNTAEAVAEAKDAELAKALEGNASLREQLADARAAAAQVPFEF